MGFLKVANRGTQPAYPIYFVDAPLGGTSKVSLPDGPNAIASDMFNPLDDWPNIAELFGIPILNELVGRWTRTRQTNMVNLPTLQPGEHCIIDTDPTHRIAVTILDPVDNIIKQFIRNSELLDWLSGHYGDSGLPLSQRFEGQGFSIPIPPRSVATLPVMHNRIGARIAVQCPQLFESALAA